MRPVSDRFLATVRGSHTATARARVCAPGQTGTNPVGVEVPILGGDVKLDSTADIQGTLDLTTSWEWPADASGLLTPYGNEIYVERGIDYGDGVTEWVGLGYYRIYDPEQDDAPDGPISITGQDRMAGIVDARPLQPVQFLTGTSISTVFTQVVGEVYPSATISYDFNASGTTLTSSHVMDDDRYGFLKDIADSLGKVMYWDYQGRLQVRTAPDAGDPVWDVTHGRDGVVVSVSRGLTREGVYNAVVASGVAVGEDAPPWGVAQDLNPSSPTYWNGTFGKVPMFYTSSFLVSPEQCQMAANAQLLRQLGVPYRLGFGAVPNPALEPFDPVRVSFSDRVGLDLHVLESLTIPLVIAQDTGAGVPMTATTKQQIFGGTGS
jgi:hypothetical protein